VSEPLVFEQKIDLPYRYTVGPAQRHFLRGLADRTLLASSDGRRAYVPARAFAPDGTRLERLVELAPVGSVVACTRAHDLDGRVFGLVQVDAAERPLLHLLDEELPAGTRVEAVWAPDAEPGILALAYFRRPMVATP